MTETAAGKKYYDLPKYYDIAFDFRNIKKQSDFLENVFEKFSKRQLNSIIELGCGPGYFVSEFAKRKKRSLGLDISGEMVRYARQRLDDPGLKGEVFQGDMISFSIPSPVDMAILMLDSVAHILTMDDFLIHLKCVADSLCDGGIYFIEFTHPGDVLQQEGRASNKWVSSRGDIEVDNTWGLASDFEDSITQITQTTVVLKIRDSGKIIEYTDSFPQKSYLAQEVRALISLSEHFDFLDWFGGFDINQPFDNSKKSWRMNVVMRKK